jgi:hypothetical protein
LLIGAAALKGGYHLAAQAWFFLEGAHAGDAKYYWTVGRAMLNGFDLYTETFDTKPPAIYLLSAVSLKLFGSPVLGYWINALIVVSIPAMFGIAAYRMSGHRFIVILSVLFGALLTLFAAFHSEGWQVEWYGAFFGIAYVLLLASNLKWKPKTLALLSLCIFGAIGFKEPFFLALLAVALLMLPTKVSFSRKFVMPTVIVAVVGVVALFAFGYAGGYFSVYLPSNTGGHIARSTPLWQRGFLVDLLGTNLWEFSVVFFVLMTLLFGAVLYWSRSKGRLRIVAVASALYLTVLASHFRGYPAANHFVVAVPFYAALFMIFLQKEVSNWTGKPSRLGALVAVCICVTVLALPFSSGVRASPDVPNNQSVADAIDAALDACDVDRYFFLEDKPYMHLTQHSPLNFFVYTGPESIVYHGPLLSRRQVDSFTQAQIAIIQGDLYEIQQRPEEKLLSELTSQFLTEHFSKQPPECAASLPSPEGYTVLFRKDIDSVTPFEKVRFK